MRTRVIGAAVALVLAVFGTLVVVTYVASADSRAFAGTKTKEVFVVATRVPEGTAAAALGDLVHLESVPARMVAEGSVTDLKQLAGEVASADLMPGEQLLVSRFADPKSLAVEGEVTVPEGMQEITIQLDPLRVLGGQLVAGDRVGVFISWTDKDQESYTHLVFDKVLVTKVQGAPAPAPTSDGGGDVVGSQAVPTESVLVTLARNAPDAERVVWASEFGKIWLSKQPTMASAQGKRVITQKEIYR